MLPSKNRLSKKPEFEKVKAEGRLFSERLFGILFIKNSFSFPRFGFIVSSKISKKAVERNRAKRVLREMARKLLPKTEGGFDVLVLAKKNLIKANQEEVLACGRSLFKKAGILK